MMAALAAFSIDMLFTFHKRFAECITLHTVNKKLVT